MPSLQGDLLTTQPSGLIKTTKDFWEIARNKVQYQSFSAAEYYEGVCFLFFGILKPTPCSPLGPVWSVSRENFALEHLIGFSRSQRYGNISHPSSTLDLVY